MKNLLDFIRPPEDASWKSVNRWRWNVTMTLLVLVAFAIASPTPIGFARAGDVDKKIAAAIEPIAKEQKSQGEKIDKVTTLLSAQLAASTATQIRLTISKRCKTTDYADREALNRELDRLQEEYVLYSKNGERYREPACADL